MELKSTNLNGEIVSSKKLNHMELLFWKIVKLAFRNESYKLFFTKRCSKCPKYKIVHNFLIANPNGMNESFPDTKKYIIYRKTNSKRKIQIFANLVLLPPSSFRHNFCSQVTIETKFIFPWSLSTFLSSKKVSKNQDKI